MILYVAWILAYTAVLANLALFAVVGILSKDRGVWAFFFVLINMALVTVTVMGLAILNVPWGRLPDFVLVNELACYNITVGFFLRALNTHPKISWRFQIVLNVLWMAALYVACGQGFAVAAQALFWLPIVVFVILFKMPTLPPKVVSLGRMGLVSGVVVFVFSVVDLLAVLGGAGRWQDFQGLFFAVFTLAYQIPGLRFTLRRLMKTDVRKSFNRLAEAPLLTPREREVAQALLAGKTYKEIAAELFLSLSGVKKHINILYLKTGVRNSRELALHLNLPFEASKVQK